MLEQLKNVSKAVDTLLASDGFPKTIRPEYLRSAVLDYPLNGGKRLRPAILIWCCRLLGGKQEQALYPAAAALAALKTLRSLKILQKFLAVK